MFLSRSTKRNAVIFAMTFLLCGLLNVIFDNVGFTECFSRVYCGVMVLLWGLSIQDRIIDGRLRCLLMLIAAQILCCSMLQVLRYHLFCGSLTAQRYLWYVHYAPMMGIAVLCFYLAACIYRLKGSPAPAACSLVTVIGVILTMGVLTNDLHFWAFRFPDGASGAHGEGERGWLIYLFMVYVLGIVILSLCVIIQKWKRYGIRKMYGLPMIPVIAEILYAIAYVFGMDPQIGGVHLWDYGEIFSICTVCFLEICIQVGMIPANKDYDKLFLGASFPAVILDRYRDPVYQTAGAEYPFAESEDVQIQRHPISGGSFEWEVDVSYTRALTQQLIEATQQVEARNAYLMEENRIKQERTEVKTRNRLYDRISRIVQAQIAEIDALLNDDGEGIEAKLPRISVLKAYIKRRSNLELLSAAGTLPVGELTAAITESLEYIRLCGTDAAISSYGTGGFPAAMLIAAYERFEAVIEDCLDTLMRLNVSVRAEKKRLTLRMMLNAGNIAYETDELQHGNAGYVCRFSMVKDDQDATLVFIFTEGGGQV